MTMEIKVQNTNLGGFYILLGSEPFGYYTNLYDAATHLISYFEKLEIQPEIKCSHAVIKDILLRQRAKSLAKKSK
jgi:hypothetical protein